MTFLNPAFLWALPLVSVPILLHLLHRRPPQIIPFGHIEWLMRVHRSAMPRKRMKEWLILLLRTLMILFLVGFFARPVLQPGAISLASSENLTTVVLLDVSASMGAVVSGQNVMDLAKHQLADVARKLPPSSKIGFIAFSDRVEQELAPTNERSRIYALLEHVKVTPRPSDGTAAVKLAYGMFANQPRGKKTLVILSDQAKNVYAALREHPGAWENYDPQVSVVAWEAVGKIKDLGVADAALQLSQEGVLKGHWIPSTSDGREKSLWSAQLNGRVVAQGEVTAEKEITFDAHLPEGGRFEGAIELPTDAMEFDNHFYLAGRVPKGFRVLIVDGDPGLAPSDSESYYLKLALESPRDPRLQSLDVVRPESFVPSMLDRYDVAVLANVPTTEENSPAIISWVEKGGGLFLTAGGRWPAPPGTPLKVFIARREDRATTAVAPPKQKVAFLNSVAGLDTFEWNEVSVNVHRVIEPESTAVTLLSLSNGDPLLLRKQIGKGNVVCLTTSVDRAWTNLPAKPIFSPLMRELIASLADPYRQQNSLNGWVDVPFKASVPPGVRTATVVAPDGKSGGAHLGPEGAFEWPSPELPGLYHVKTDNKDADFTFAINIRDLVNETNVEKISERELKAIFPKAAVDWVPAGGNSASRAISSLQGRDVTGFLIISIIVFLLLETFLSRRKSQVPIGEAA